MISLSKKFQLIKNLCYSKMQSPWKTPWKEKKSETRRAERSEEIRRRGEVPSARTERSEETREKVLEEKESPKPLTFSVWCQKNGLAKPTYIKDVKEDVVVVIMSHP